MSDKLDAVAYRNRSEYRIKRLEEITINTGSEDKDIKVPSIFDTPGVHRDNVEEFAIYSDIFSKQECKDIIDYYKNNIDPHDSVVGDGVVDKKVRNCIVRFADPKKQREELAFVFDKIRQVVQTANERHFGFELTGPLEPMQFLEYNGAEEQHYSPHSDREYNTIARKLSVSILLSDQNDFEGGDIRFPYARDITLSMKQGSILLFPSFTIHEVLPVTKGTRYSLVMWVAGPSFR